MSKTITRAGFISYTIAFVFLFSAFSKLIAVNYFHEYIYSIGWFNLNFSIILAHLIIAAEAGIGIAYLRCRPLPLLTVCSFLLLIMFSFVLVYMHFTVVPDECFCFGRLLQLPFGVTLCKNIALIALVLWQYRLALKKCKHTSLHPARTLIILAGTLLISFGWHFPFSRWMQPSNGNTPMCKTCLHDFVSNQKLNQGRKVVLFLSSDCNYCQLTAKRITNIVSDSAQRTKIVTALFDEKQNPDSFYILSGSYAFRTIKLTESDFLRITEGTYPLVVLINKGKVYKAYRYKDLDEHQIRRFLNTD